jgi:cytochrome c-type biogenesis protein CcmH/NrfG
LDPGSPTGHLFLAGALRGLGRFDEAIREFQEALKLAPGDQAAQRGLQETLAAKAGSSGTSGTGTKP